MSRLWARVREPRVKRIIMCSIYVLAFVMGAATIIWPLPSIETRIGTGLNVALGTLLMVCGGFGAYGVIPGLWWAERVAVRAGITGATIYIGTLINALHEYRVGYIVPPMAAVVIVALVFAMRAHEIRGLNYEPRPESEVTRGRHSGIRHHRCIPGCRDDPA